MKYCEINEISYEFIQNTQRSLFLTGKAGSGKTTFLKHLIKHTHKNTIVCAPTGVAAINAGGVTLHSFFQLPFTPYLPDRFKSYNDLSRVSEGKIDSKLLQNSVLIFKS